MSSDFIRREEEDLSDLDLELRKPAPPVQPPRSRKSLPRGGKLPPPKRSGGSKLFVVILILLISLGAIVAGGLYLYKSGIVKSELKLAALSPVKKLVKNQIKLRVVPKDAVLLFDGKPQTVTVKEDGTGFFEVTGSGEHTLTFQKDGYRTAERNLNLSGGALYIELELKQKTPGIVTLTCPISQLKFTLDGESVEPSGFLNDVYTLKLPSGKHELVISRTGFSEVKKELDIPSDDGMDLGLIEIKDLGWKSMSVNVTPRNAHIFVDGREIQLTEQNGQLVSEPLEPKICKVEIKAEGYQDWSNDKFEIFSDIPNSLGPVTLTPIKELVKSDKSSKSSNNSDKKSVNKSSNSEKSSDKLKPDEADVKTHK